MFLKFFKVTGELQPENTMISTKEGILTSCLLNNTSSSNSTVKLFLEDSMEFFTVELAPNEFRNISLEVFITSTDNVKIYSVDSGIHVLLSFIDNN